MPMAHWHTGTMQPSNNKTLDAANGAMRAQGTLRHNTLLRYKQLHRKTKCEIEGLELKGNQS